MKWSLILLFASSLLAAGGPRLFYSRAFPGSSPAYLQVTLEKSGDANYREAVDDELPIQFHLAGSETARVFALAEKLDHFKRPLESPLKVAFMGAKTFRWDNGAETSEAKFNFTEDVTARELQDWFERMAESAQHRIGLERAAKYDRLGVFQALNLLDSALERNRLVALEQYLPMLDRIAGNENFMHTARAHAAAIAEAIRNPKPDPGANPGGKANPKPDPSPDPGAKPNPKPDPSPDPGAQPQP